MWQLRFVPITKNNINNKDCVYKCAAISSQNNAFLLYKVRINILFVAFYFETRKILQRLQCHYMMNISGICKRLKMSCLFSHKNHLIFERNLLYGVYVSNKVSN